MSLDKLKQHAQSQIESLADKKALLLKKLDERGVLHSGYSVVPDLAEVELRMIDWNDALRITEVIDEKGEGAKEFVAHIEKRIAYEVERHCDYVPMPASSSVLADGSYTGGLSWLYRFDAEIEPTGETQPSATKEDVTDEFYTVRFPDGVDGASLLDDCDCVVTYEVK